MSCPFTGGIISGRFPYVSHETLQIVLEYRNVQGNGQIIIGIDRIRKWMEGCLYAGNNRGCFPVRYLPGYYIPFYPLLVAFHRTDFLNEDARNLRYM
jgi:hypothetical protein